MYYPKIVHGHNILRTPTGKMYLPSGTVCHAGDLECMDVQDGNTYWQLTPSSTCDFSGYDVLYEGNAQKIQEVGSTNAPEIFSVISNDITFALTRTTSLKICGYELYRTEHPKLFILETQAGNTFPKSRDMSVENMDLFTYINSKFIYVERHIRNQVNSLYTDIIRQKCDMERQLLEITLSTAASNPIDFAYTLMKGPGYTADPAGEVIYVIKCIPVRVEIRETTDCFLELPVTFLNESYFVAPRSRVLKRYGTKRDCSSVLPTRHLTEHGWVRLLPKALDVSAPEKLKPKTRLTWRYLSPGNLATSGIYSQSDIDRLRDHIMFSAERPALTNNVIRSFSGRPSMEEGISIHHLLDETALEKITQTTMGKIWMGMTTFGTTSAGLLGIYMVYVIIKLTLDTLLHGYALHAAYRWGIHLVGACWNSLTNLLLHRAVARGQNQEPEARRGNNEVERANGTVPEEPHPGTGATIYPTLHRTRRSMDLRRNDLDGQNNRQPSYTPSAPHTHSPTFLDLTRA
ncbi:uncharacterized protein [Prorops nasuta]|uniref:uncharacterized protein n=1 Tax=Prorops nasuta TaxID=863751 RepID=UPI0034CFEE19